VEQTNIMIVEDEAITALYLEKELSGMGLNVCCVADTGAKAIEFATKHAVDVILMDVRLKDNIDGVRAAEVINQGIPVIYHTAFADEETLTRASRTKPVAILEKPASIHLIRETIAKALARGK